MSDEPKLSDAIPLLQLILTVGIVAWLILSVPAWIGAGERGVLMEWGRVNENVVLTPGVHLLIPIYHSVAKMDVQTQVVEAELLAASKDIQDAKTTVAVNFHVAPDSVSTLYRDIGRDYQTRVIAPAIQDIGKTSTANFSAEELIQKRDSVRSLFQSRLTERMLARGIIVEQVSITNFKFGDVFTKTIEDKVSAQQLYQKAEFDLQRITIEAKQKVAQAEGEKQATILIAEGRAKEVEIIQDQLMQSPQYINYMAVRSWNGVLPMVTGDGGIPLIQLPTIQATAK